MFKKNHIGRPSNKELKKSAIKKFLLQVYLCCLLF